jgi:hypothetical protein
LARRRPYSAPVIDPDHFSLSSPDPESEQAIREKIEFVENSLSFDGLKFGEPIKAHQPAVSAT